jgi:26S proteasome regulatory subunit N13
MLYVTQSADQLVHFCWRERSASQPEEDLIVFPGDAEFSAVPKCTTGRVFMLRFRQPERKLLFWMQEPSADKDAELCSDVNLALNEVARLRGAFQVENMLS